MPGRKIEKPYLKDCPFCGAGSEFIELTGTEDGLCIWCMFCCVKGPSANTEERAVLKWNRRATE
jgi:Lar family restriction alleviation protein